MKSTKRRKSLERLWEKYSREKDRWIEVMNDPETTDEGYKVALTMAMYYRRMQDSTAERLSDLA